MSALLRFRFLDRLNGLNDYRLICGIQHSSFERTWCEAILLWSTHRVTDFAWGRL